MVILITGASHTGKTVLAQRMLEKYQYPYYSYCTKEWLTQENDKIINGFVQAGEQVVIIDDDYESEIGNGF